MCGRKHWLIISLIYVSLAGCVSWRQISEPHIIPSSEWRLSKVAYAGIGGSQLESRDLSITLKAHNEGKKSTVMIFPIPLPLGSLYGEDSSGSRYFVVSTNYSARVAGFVVNPARLELRLEDKKATLYPVGYIKRPVQNRVFLACMNAHYTSGYDVNQLKGFTKVSEANTMIALPLGEDVCVDVFYEVTPPQRSTMFSVAIDGVTKEGREYIIPGLMFREGRGAAGW